MAFADAEPPTDLPALTRQPRTFELNESEADASNTAFQEYQIASGQDAEIAPFKSLTQALQHARPPELVDLMESIRLWQQEQKQDHLAEDEDVLYYANAIAMWTDWRQRLAEDNKRRSSRIEALIDIFNARRDTDPSCSVVIFDEGVYFLDIVEIAFAAMFDPVKCLRYDGRAGPDKRGMILHQFKEADGFKVLLVSRRAGGVGLNIPYANVVIQCGPWWKQEWEEEAMRCAWRAGQTRPVTRVSLFAKNCDAEVYKESVRDRKHGFDRRVLGQITRRD